MGGKIEVIENEGENVKPISNTRILWLMALVTVAAGAAGIVFKSWLFGSGVLIGGVLAFLNYYWLKHSLKQVFDMATEGAKPAIFGAQYILRYLVFGLVLSVIFLTDAIPIIAVVLGLASFALAVVIEGILRIVSSVGN